MKLTKAAIDSMTYRSERGQKDIHWDDEVHGFGVRVWESGRRVFVLKYRAAGRQRLLTLGPYGVLTVQQARDQARQRLGEVLQGKDPMLQREKERRGSTVNDLCDAYLERHAERRKASARDDRRMIDAHLKPRFGAMRIEAVRREDIARLHDSIGREHPTTANRMLSLVSGMWNKAKLWGYLTDAAPNPAKGIERFPEVKRERFVTKDEMPALIEAIDEVPNVFAKAALWLYLLTGLRKNEVLKLRWEHIDLKQRTLYLPTTKAGRSHHLPLSPPAVELLAALPRICANPWVICGKNDKSHMVDLRYYWDDVREEAGLTDVRIHDLRHTIASWLVSSGTSLALIGRVLNHSQARTTQRYAHFEAAPVAKVLDDHARALRAPVVVDVQAEVSPESEVDERSRERSHSRTAATR